MDAPITRDMDPQAVQRLRAMVAAGARAEWLRDRDACDILAYIDSLKQSESAMFDREIARYDAAAEALLMPRTVATSRVSDSDLNRPMRLADVYVCPAPREVDGEESSDTTRDIREVLDFVVGWWPGLEGGISWGGDEGSHPVFLAAKRAQAALADGGTHA